MKRQRAGTPLLLLALSLGLGACGGGEEKGTMEQMEGAMEQTELSPDTAGPGPGMGMGAGSMDDTVPAGPRGRLGEESGQ